MNHNSSRFLKFICLASAGVMIFISCKKDPSAIGLDIHPESDKVNAAYYSSNGLFAYTFSEDSLTTDERSYALLGSYTDPVFGKSTASFITQMRLISFSTDFGSNAHADSMKIILDYSSYYGDTSQSQSFSIYKLSSPVYPDSTYYSNFDVSSVVTPSDFIASYTYQPKPNDTALIINLPVSFAQTFIDAQSSVYNDNTTFLDFFKGFLFQADSANPSSSIIYFNLLSTRTKVILYYSNDSTATSYNFAFNTNCARINLFSHNYSGSLVTGLNDSVNSSQNLFIQGMSGTGMKIFFPGLESWKDSGKVIISKAELVIPVNSGFSATPYSVPAKLLNVAVNSDKTYSFLPDYLVGENYFDGVFNASANEYRFNIGRYIQQIVDGTREDYGIAVLCSDNRISANRVVINNTGNSNGLRLDIYYFKP